MKLEDRYLVQTPLKRNGDCAGQGRQSNRGYPFNGDCKPPDQSRNFLQAESGRCTNCASRIRHSSSLIAGISVGTIEGTGCK
jgi:hypothetical protein